MLRKDRREVAVEGHVIADKNFIAYGHRQTHGLVMRVSQAQCEPTAGEGLIKFEQAKELVAVGRDRKLAPVDGDVSKRKSLLDCINQHVVRYGLVGFG